MRIKEEIKRLGFFGSLPHRKDKYLEHSQYQMEGILNLNLLNRLIPAYKHYSVTRIVYPKYLDMLKKTAPLWLIDAIAWRRSVALFMVDW